MIKGILFLILASFCFALSTAYLKIGINPPYNISPAIATFSRFFLGFIVFGTYLVVKNQGYKPVKLKFVLMRGLMNTLAVIVFFLGIKYTTITKANILNLTYPIFVFIVSPYITGEKANRKDYIFLAFSLIGAWFIIIPGGGFNGFGSVNVGDMLCLLSGLISGFGISYLRQARKFDSAPMILTYQMAIGTVLCFFTMLPGFAMPSTKGLLFVAITATLTVFGQFFITEGYMYVSAALGSVVSGSGILFAAMFGILFFNDPITINIVIGGGFILLALFGAGKFFEKAKQYLPFFD